ncbi:MAG TPA: SDR family oxidoreductase [Candidatus Hydrogenedentes bacterium]|nr:SDR family oxidoreductase [Candidatus Hydrogenedentota bacterium]HPG68665.1 SDR family oxidoreductase [Candidatus Hydrogenedentota bacterium]
MGKVAFITGATRGVGKACALKLASHGWDIAVAARSIQEDPRTPGTIFSAAEEIGQHGTKVLPVECNVVDLDSIEGAVAATLDTFGRIDAVVNNAGALWWRPVEDTPMKRFDLVMNVNVRGAFAVTSGFLPIMKQQNSGHVIFMSPPIDLAIVPGHVAYAISKFGMTMTAMGLAGEFEGTGISATALWPRTIIESYATINFHMGLPSMWRKPDILADALYEILQRPEETRGKALLDEDFLRSIGYTDFDQYKCEPDGQPLELTSGIMRMSRF